jgi:hypothetical protein
MIDKSRPAPDRVPSSQPVQDRLKVSPRRPIGLDISIEGAIGSSTVRLKIPAYAAIARHPVGGRWWGGGQVEGVDVVDGGAVAVELELQRFKP